MKYSSSYRFIYRPASNSRVSFDLPCLLSVTDRREPRGCSCCLSLSNIPFQYEVAGSVRPCQFSTEVSSIPRAYQHCWLDFSTNNPPSRSIFKNLSIILLHSTLQCSIYQNIISSLVASIYLFIFIFRLLLSFFFVQIRYIV